jgi:hypothetical protein
MRRRPQPGSIRNVVTGRSDGYTGRVPFVRLGQKTVAFESLLARDFLLLTSAFEHDICEIHSEPFRLPVEYDGSSHTWLPDYQIIRASGIRELIEVKPVEVLHPERSKSINKGPEILAHSAQMVSARMRALQSSANQHGYKFRLLTEDEIRIQPRLDNAALVLRHAGYGFPKSWVLEARLALTGSDIKSVAELQAVLRPELDAFPIAIHLAWLGDIEFDPTTKFTRSSAFVRMSRHGSRPTTAFEGSYVNG